MSLLDIAGNCFNSLNDASVNLDRIFFLLLEFGNNQFGHNLIYYEIIITIESLSNHCIRES